MIKGTIKGLRHEKEFLWFSLEPSMLTVQRLDIILRKVDSKWKEGINPEKKQYYENIAPIRFTHYSPKGNIYAISIFNNDLVDFILFKKSPIFEQVSKLIVQNFKFAKPVKVRELRKKEN